MDDATDPTPPASRSGRLPIAAAVIHPVVLLSIVDHHNRACKNTKKRAVGILLGTVSARGQVDVYNSYAVPFEEDERNPQVFFFDHDYVEHMAAMFRKVTARERIIGWYSTGPKIRPADPDIDDIVRGFCASGRSLYLICKVEPTELGLPTETYVSVSDESSVLGVSSGVRRRVFEHVPCSIGALEAEEVGTEHLLRDVKDAAAVTTLAADVSAKLEALRSLTGRLRRIRQYVEQVAAGQLPIHNEIMYALQDVLNRLPRLGGEHTQSLTRALTVTVNDQMLTVYLASLVRAILALHDLINNKMEVIASERKMEKALAAPATTAKSKSVRDHDTT
ncbi:hypothetical protein CDCA_CDCA02G0655 [Cyanidium caldarium]|uniref:MPN domain-containing protein n=1 Tax=Cyanidium caldarium TaxID=2771 RepID=A0AAV9IRC2_CYACA|nr:hypothetical protein CDCA_CDCA02G0655 [Cyanidium caldarium]